MSRPTAYTAASTAKRAMPVSQGLLDKLQEDAEPECERCRSDGMDPWCDYLLPCPACQEEQRPCEPSVE